MRCEREEAIGRAEKWITTELCQPLRTLIAEGRVGIEPGPHRRAADRERIQPGPARPHRLQTKVDLADPGADLLAQGERGGVLQMGAPGLDHRSKGFSALGERVAQALHRGQEAFTELEHHRHVHCGGESVIGGLPAVDVVVRVHRLLAAKLATRQLDGTVGNHLVGVHVGLRTRSGLKHEQRKMRIQPPVDHLISSAHDELGHGRRQFAQLGIRQRRGLLQQAQRTDHRPLPAKALDPDGEMFDRALSLRPPVAISLHLDATHRIGFRTCGIHGVLLLLRLSLDADTRD